MNISKELVRIAKSVGRTAGTGNFSITNRCVVIPDELYEFGDAKDIEKEVESIPGIYYEAVVKPGYYQASSIDIEEKGWPEIDDLEYMFDDLVWDTSSWFETQAKLETAFKNGLSSALRGDNELANAAWDVLKTGVKKVYDMVPEKLEYFNMEREGEVVKDEDGELVPETAVAMSAEPIEAMYAKIKELDYEKIDEAIDKIADKWGLVEYGVEYRFSNGETGYTPIRYPNTSDK